MASSVASAGQWLPVELLDEIFREDVLSKADYCSLSRVSHHFCVLARPRLFFERFFECASLDNTRPLSPLSPQSQLRLRFLEKQPQLAKFVRAVHRKDGPKASYPGNRAGFVKLGMLWDRLYAAFPQLEEVNDDRFLPTPSHVPACASSLRFVATPLLDKTLCKWLSQLPKLQSLSCSFNFNSPKSLLTTAPLPSALTELCLKPSYRVPTQLRELIGASSATLRSLDLDEWGDVMTDFSGLPAFKRFTFRLCCRFGKRRQDAARVYDLLRKSGLPTLQYLKTLVIRPGRVYSNAGQVFRVIAHPEIISLFPKTLERLLCDDVP